MSDNEEIKELESKRKTKSVGLKWVCGKQLSEKELEGLLMSDNEEIVYDHVNKLSCCACGKLLDDELHEYYEVGNKMIHSYCLDKLLMMKRNFDV